MRTLIVYDISDDKRRTKLYKYLKNMGLQHVQYSAFLGDIPPADIPLITKCIQQYVKEERDVVFVIPLCLRCFKNLIIISLREVLTGENIIV